MINIEKINDVLLVSLQNDSKLNVTISQSFKQEVTKLIDQPGMKIIINLGDVEYIDSSGFGALLSVLRASKNNESQLKLCNISPDVMELVKLLQLHSVFDIRDSVDDCIKSFKL
jgi:anti-sigma B factor antagonist